MDFGVEYIPVPFSSERPCKFQCSFMSGASMILARQNRHLESAYAIGSEHADDSFVT